MSCGSGVDLAGAEHQLNVDARAPKQVVANGAPVEARGAHRTAQRSEDNISRPKRAGGIGRSAPTPTTRGKNCLDRR
jgi:hypothetical protein